MIVVLISIACCPRLQRQFERMWKVRHLETEQAGKQQNIAKLQGKLGTSPFSQAPAVSLAQASGIRPSNSRQSRRRR